MLLHVLVEYHAKDYRLLNLISQDGLKIQSKTLHDETTNQLFLALYLTGMEVSCDTAKTECSITR